MFDNLPEIFPIFTDKLSERELFYLSLTNKQNCNTYMKIAEKKYINKRKRNQNKQWIYYVEAFSPEFIPIYWRNVLVNRKAQRAFHTIEEAFFHYHHMISNYYKLFSCDDENPNPEELETIILEYPNNKWEKINVGNINNVHFAIPQDPANFSYPIIYIGVYKGQLEYIVRNGFEKYFC